MKGLEYFPLCCHMSDSLKVFEANEGLEGFAVVIKLWQSIYSGEGYYKLFDKDVRILFAKEIGMDLEKLEGLTQAAVDREIFDKELYEKYEILTSDGVQKRFFKCAERRKKIPVKKEYLLVKTEQFLNLETGDSTGIEENVNIFQQSKVKKSKVKKSKVKKSRVKAKPKTAPPPPDDPEILNQVKKAYGEYENILLDDEEYEALKTELGETTLLGYIKKVDEYVQIYGKEYSDYYAVIKKWVYEDSEEEAEKETQKLVKKSKFNNYEDTGNHYYSGLMEEALSKLLDDS